MTISILVSNERKNPKVEEYVRDHVEMVLGRFTNRVSQIDVRIADENNGKGGHDKVCTMDVTLIPRGVIHLKAKHESVYGAITRAIHRTEAVVAKSIDKQQTIRRRSKTEPTSEEELLANESSAVDTGEL